MSIIESFFNTVDVSPDKAAIIYKDISLSFKELKDVSLKLAYSLKKLGIKKGDRIATYLPTIPEYFISYLAIYQLGAVAVPLDFMLMADELESCLSHSDSKVLIAKNREGVALSELKERVPSLEYLIFVGDNKDKPSSFENLINGSKVKDDIVKVDEQDNSMIIYTSGSTGRPKGVVLTYKHQDAMAKTMHHTTGLDSQTTVVCALPLSHLGGYVYFSCCVYLGCTVVLSDRFIPVDFLRNIEKYKVKAFWLVPPMYYALLHLKEFERFDLSNLEWVVVFGASSSPDALRRFHQYCPKADFINGWGMTETCGPTIVLPKGSKKIESIGVAPSWVKINVFDDNDKEVKKGQTGEIVVKSWVVMKEYYKDPEFTREVLRNGWLHTGDMGKFDDEGYLYVVGRKKDMLKVAGQLVYAPEVEECIHKHPAVSEVAVIGIPDELRGEVPKAFIVIKENENIKEQDLRDFCRDHLAHFKIPHFFEFQKSLPKTGSGKIDKVALKSL